MKRFLRSQRILTLATGVLLVALVAVSLVSWSLGRSAPHALADSTTWTSVSGLPANTDLTGVACPNVGSILCAAVGSSSGQAAIFTTTNGTTWTSVSGLPADAALRGIACPNVGGLLCAAVGDTPSGSQGVILVTVKGAAAQISDLITTVNSLHLPMGLQTSLDAKLRAALSSVNAGNTTAACGQLGTFINKVQAQAGKMLTLSQAQQLQSDATQIQTILAC